jgi:membrane fusion protein (multidrug efflux system)
MPMPLPKQESWLNREFRSLMETGLRAKRRLYVLGLIVILPVLASIGCGPKEQAAPPPPDVEVVEVAQRDVPVTKEWVATFAGKVNAQVRAQVTGYLIKQNYSNGAFVSQGSPLFQIDPQPFQAALEGAKGNLAVAQGDLAKAQAQQGKTQLDVTRYTPLAKESAISQQELDDAVQANLAAQAQVQSAKAAIDTAKAAVETAQLNLGFTKIVSPVDGIAGIASGQVGDLVGPAAPALTTVSTINPILVDFTPTEQEYLNAMRLGGGEEEVKRRLDFELTLTDGSTYPYKGRLYSVGREIDVRTGAILVEVQFPNPGNLLRPGGFARISAVTKIQKDALLVPALAVSELQGGYLIAVVGDDNKVSLRPVKMGDRAGRMWIVAEGLKAGERVIAEGTQKVKEGIVVNPKPFQEKPAAST